MVNSIAFNTAVSPAPPIAMEAFGEVTAFPCAATEW
ncbi:hypothetical protein M2306_001647 [Myroides gitamensis]|nr:hypothetical protein [Myroides odoratus]MDH6600953.1 hypothetical protein [Myroides gitamensis]